MTFLRFFSQEEFIQTLLGENVHMAKLAGEHTEKDMLLCRTHCIYLFLSLFYYYD